jgi:hypothetical protein
MADYNPSGRTRTEREELRSSGQDSSRNDSHSDTNWAEFELNVRDVMLELGDLLIKKHRDYGPKNISNSPYGATNGLVVRMWDKIARIVNLTKGGKNITAENEPLEDSFKDIANYGIIGLLVLRGKWDN